MIDPHEQAPSFSKHGSRLVAGEGEGAADPGEISDGYHTFNELYQHRHALFLALLKERGGWACRTHADGTMYEGQFIAGMDLDGRQISYHLPVELWAIADDLGVVVDEMPEWDGHSSDDVALRLLEYAMSKELED